MAAEKLKTLRRDAIIVVLVTLALLALAELTAGYALHFRERQTDLAVLEASTVVRNYIYRAEAKHAVESFRHKWGLKPGDAWDPFFSDAAGMLDAAEAEYTSEFDAFVALARGMGSKVVLLYVPSEAGEPARSVARAFFRSLARKERVRFVDLSDAFARYPRTATTFAPWDPHLSRFGHEVVAGALRAALADYRGYRAHATVTRHPDGLADLPPNFSAIWEERTDVPYRVVTNAYGFRMGYDFPLDDPRQKILVLGDSYTFGPYVPDHDLYTTMLDEMLPDAIVMNAGLFGYTITDELGLFRERARFAGPDVTVLQAVDNDLIGLLFFYKNHFNRKKRLFAPSEQELKFLRVVAQRTQAGATSARAPQTGRLRHARATHGEAPGTTR